jgi:hypothetical protein
VARAGEADMWAVEKVGGELELGHGREENGERGSGWQPAAFQAPRWRGAAREKGRWVPGERVHMSDGEGGEGAPSTAVGSTGRPVMAPDHRARAAALSRNKGERLIGGAGRQRGPVLSGGVRERVRESGVAQRRGADR